MPDSDSATPAARVALRPENIPASLKYLNQWCVWCYGPKRRNGKRSKVPYQPNGKPAKSNDATTWNTFDACLAAYQSGKFAGIGVFLSGNLAGVDLDGCRDADGATPDAAEILGKFAGTYAEVSPSGAGYRVLCYGKPGRSGKNDGAVKWVEVYAEPSSRFLTVTGNAIATAEVTEQQAALDWLHQRYFAGASQPDAEPEATSQPDTPPPPPVFTSLSDAELIEKASRNDNFAALWRGDTSGHDGDASSADMALCGRLAWWTNSDAAAMDRLFRQSALFRDKWDSKRGATTYGAMTIATAITNCHDGYTGQRPDSDATRGHAEATSGHTEAGKGEHGGGGTAGAGGHCGTAGAAFDDLLLANCGIGLEPEPDEPPPGQGRTNQEAPRKSLFVDAATLTTNPRAPDWLIRNWIVRDSLTTMFGDPGGGKSLLALDWACCVATGRHWNGCRVKPGVVLYIAGEGFAGIARRLVAWQLENQSLPPGRLFISERPVLLNEAGAAVVLEEVAALSEPPALVEVDTLARSLDGNENDAGDMGTFIRALDTIRVNTGCATVVLHHCGAADKNRARGHTSLKGAVDMEISVESTLHTGQEAPSGVVRCTKAKDSEPAAPLAFEIHGVTLPKEWWDAEEPDKPVTGATLHVTGEVPAGSGKARKLSPTSVIALDALRDALVQHGVEMAGVVSVTAEQWRDTAYGRGISDSEEPNSRNKAFNRARKDLLIRGAVVCFDERYWIPKPKRGTEGQGTNP